MFTWLRRLLHMDPTPSLAVNSKLLTTLGGVDIYQAGSIVHWTGGLTIDADGSPYAYHPKSNLGLDNLANAGRPGNWWALACGAGGLPVIQIDEDPAPGFYVSTTALCDPRKFTSDPLKYVDSGTIPYVVLPRGLRTAETGKEALSLGDFALVINLANGHKVPAICADIGPSEQIGEGSIALANALDVPSSPRTGGCTYGIVTILFPGSRTTPAWPHTVAEINAHVIALVSTSHLDFPDLG